MKNIRPQEGAQTLFLSNSADIAICGGAAFGGKTFSLLLEAARHINNPRYQGIIFRRESVQITSPGGLRDTSLDVYPHLGGMYRAQPTPRWIFPSGAQITFAHLNNEDTVLNYQGSQMTLICYDELTHFCVDDQTEALTENGWKFIKDISIGELVASLSKNRQIQYQPVTQVYENDYSGEMVVIEQRNGIDVKVTPNHRMVVNVSDTGLQGKAAFCSWKFVEARNLMTCSIPRTGDWIGEEVEYQYFEPIYGRGYGTNSNSCVEYVPTDDWLEFLGWYLSEGCCYCRNNRTNTRVVCIRQTKPNGQLLLEEVLDRLPWRYSKTKDGQYLFFSRQLYEELAGLGDTYTKRVPRWIFSLSKRQISLFLDAFTAGDGHITPTNGIAFGLANEKLIDDLQELYFKCGRVSTKSYGKVAGKYDVWRLGVSNPKRSHCFVNIKDSRYESYEGKIYCLSVRENENFMMRRNGRICWTGNSRFQFFYMLSRARSMSGIKPYIRASTNPDSDSWVAEFIKWWISEETGYPIQERSGVLRYLMRVNDNLVWGDSKEELMSQHGCDANDINSVTFVPSKATDNPLGLQADPSYIGRLKAMSRVERARLLDGNWKIKAIAGMYFPRFDATIVDWKPEDSDVIKWIRSWDLAASEETEGRDPDHTVGLLVGRRANGKIIIADMVRVRRKAADVRSLVLNLARKDGKETWVAIPRDPGQAGKEQAESYIKMLQGFTVISRSITRNKTTMAEPAAALWQQGNIEMVRAPWNDILLQELEQFPEGKHDDIVDCLSAAVVHLPGHAKPDYSQSGLNGRFKEVRSKRVLR